MGVFRHERGPNHDKHITGTWLRTGGYHERVPHGRGLHERGIEREEKKNIQIGVSMCVHMHERGLDRGCRLACIARRVLPLRTSVQSTRWWRSCVSVSLQVKALAGRGARREGLACVLAVADRRFWLGAFTCSEPVV